MSYSRVKMGFRNLSVAAQIEKSRTLANQVARLPPEQRPEESLARLLESLTEAERVQRELFALRATVRGLAARQNSAMRELRLRASSCANAMTGQVRGDEAALRRTGLEVVPRHRPRVGPPPVVTELRAVALTGGVKLRWKTKLRRCWYKVQFTPGLMDRAEWQGDLVSVRGRAEMHGLTSGAVYSFRVKAHNSNGEAEWSQAVSVRVN